MSKIYARKLCSKCYYKSNQVRSATKCVHTGLRPHYSKGRCRSCYLQLYYLNRKKIKIEEELDNEETEKEGENDS